jgi:hypothetical protein
MTGPYGRAARRYLAAGWSPLPLPARKKKEPPTGWTGQAAPMASAADVEAWCEDHPGGNIAVRLPPTVVGIDVDAYKGPAEAAAWAELVQRFGPLPEAVPWCTSRDDGVSGVRLLAVPAGYKAVTDLGLAGEVIQHHHRYVVVPPSIHPDTGKPYRWVNAPNGRIPDAGKLPPLPPAWLEGLRAGNPAAVDGGARTSWTDPDIDTLAEHGIPTSEPRHDDRLRDVVWRLYAEGLNKPAIRAVWLTITSKTALKDPARPWTDADFERHWQGASRKIGTVQFKPGGAVRTDTSDRPVSEDTGALISRSDTSDTSDSGSDDVLLAGARDGAWLSAQQFPPLRYAVPELIPEGFTLHIGPPKVGKSWLLLNLLLAIAAGGRALGQIDAGDPQRVLYLALEDSDRRMQDRCRALLGPDDEIPALFTYLTRVEPGMVLATIAAWMRRHPATALVAIDTLGKVMPPAAQGESAYQRDYRIGSAVKMQADAYPGLAIVVSHHDRKAAADDFIDSVSGTHGLAGAADTIAVLARKRQSGEGTLKIVGRDVPEDEYALTLTDGKAWRLDGASLADAAAAARRHEDSRALGDTSAEIIEFVRQRPEGVYAREVVEKFGKDAYQYLKRLTQAGRIDKAGRGLYIASYTPVSEPSKVSESQASHPGESDNDLESVRRDPHCGRCGAPISPLRFAQAGALCGRCEDRP